MQERDPGAVFFDLENNSFSASKERSPGASLTYGVLAPRANALSAELAGAGVAAADFNCCSWAWTLSKP